MPMRAPNAWRVDRRRRAASCSLTTEYRASFGIGALEAADADARCRFRRRRARASSRIIPAPSILVHPELALHEFMFTLLRFKLTRCLGASGIGDLLHFEAFSFLPVSEG